MAPDTRKRPAAARICALMVRKGSSVRVRCWAWEKGLQTRFGGVSGSPPEAELWGPASLATSGGPAPEEIGDERCPPTATIDPFWATPSFAF